MFVSIFIIYIFIIYMHAHLKARLIVAKVANSGKATSV